ncbi:MAG: adenosine kinase [Alloprevotella sp.]|nr:adenosine kinase [Alloprevotella sp.]
MERILGIGNALVDVLAQVESEHVLQAMKLPKGSMQLLSDKRFGSISSTINAMPTKLATGGSACNTILALGNLGARPGVIGKIGDDSHGRFFENNCLEHGITPHLIHDTRPTGVASTFITPDGQRTFGTYLGAAARLTPEEIRPEWFDNYAYLYIEGYLVQNHRLVERALDFAHERGMRIGLDMASYNIVEEERDFFAHLLEKVDIVFANEEEARAFSGKTPREALDELGDICGVAVVKTGKAGAMAKAGDEIVQVPARPVERVVDTTGAGDFFAAGFLYGHSRGDNLAECVRKATVLAAYVIEVVGTKLSDRVWDAIRHEVAPLKSFE